MLVSDYVSDLVTGELKPLSVSNVGGEAPNEIQEVNIKVIIGYLNRANEKVHERFSLIQREIILEGATNNTMHDLPVDTLYPISAAFADAREIPLNNERKEIVDCTDVNVSLMFPSPFKCLVKGTDPVGCEQISILYCAAPKKISGISDFVDLNVNFNEALYNYTAYLAHGSVNGHVDQANNTYYMRYLASCKEIVDRGLLSDNLGSSIKLDERGFVRVLIFTHFHQTRLVASQGVLMSWLQVMRIMRLRCSCRVLSV